MFSARHLVRFSVLNHSEMICTFSKLKNTCTQNTDGKTIIHTGLLSLQSSWITIAPQTTPTQESLFLPF